MQDEVFETMHAGEMQSAWEELGFDEISVSPYNPTMWMKVGRKELTLYADATLHLHDTGKGSTTLKDVNFCFVADLIELLQKEF